MGGFSLFASVIIFVNIHASVWEPAIQCANEMLEGYPDLAKEWIYENGTFGGRESAFFVGWVDNRDTPLPRINMQDGPQGVRDILNGQKLENRTSWPGAATYGMAWNEALAYHAGKLGAKDWEAIGATVALTPGVNVHRLPTNGRNWEYISGEDAHLGSLGGHLVSGLQSNGLMGSLKHFALNSQELNREYVISVIDEATLMETYLTAFQPCIDAGVGSVMCSYNQIQFLEDPSSFAYSCGSERLSHTLLRQTLDYPGALMTDWNAQVSNTTNGHTSDQRQWVDWEMRWGSDILYQVPEGAGPSIVRNSLVGMFASGMLTNSSVSSCTQPGVKIPSRAPPLDDLPAAYQAVIGDESTADFAAVLLSEAMVMLKNDKATLPLSVTQKILLMGTALLNGGGSGDSAAFGWFQEGHAGEGVHNGGRYGQRIMQDTLATKFGSVTWDFDVEEELVFTDYDIILVFGAQFRSEAYLVNNTDGFLNIDQCDSSQNYSTYGDCDYAGLLSSFQAARSAGTKVVSVTTTGGVHYPDYMHLVDSSMTMIYPGQYFAAALTKVLAGEVAPGGKLTFTLPALEDDDKHIQSPVGRFNKGLEVSSTQRNYTIHYPASYWDPNTKTFDHDIKQYDYNSSEYAEKGLVGYKYYEKYDMTPMFPFGYGLSYADFEVQTVDFAGCQSQKSCSFVVRVTENSNFKGIASEVLQVYVGYTSYNHTHDTMRPIKELKAFKKVWKAGSYTINLPSSSFYSSWNVPSQSWVLPCTIHTGYFTVYVGTSSSDIREEKAVFVCTTTIVANFA